MTKAKLISPGDEYNEHTCITAAELREMGFKIPEHIPNCAWVPRDSLLPVGDLSIEADSHDNSRFHMSLFTRFTKPFKWIGADVVIPMEKTDE